MEPETMSPIRKALNSISKAFVGNFLMTPEQGAATQLYLATDPDVEGVSGKYFIDSKASDRINCKAFDLDLRQKLWDLSCEMTRVDFDVDKVAPAKKAVA
jgi:hypothetical protein